MPRFKPWLLAALVLLLPALAGAFDVTPATPMIFKATGSVRVLDDPSGSLTSAQAKARLDEFRPLAEMARLERTHHYWMLVTLDSKLPQERELRIELPAWEETHSFVIGDDGSLRELPVTGTYWGSHSRLVDANPFSTPIGEARSQYPLVLLVPGKTTRILMTTYRSALATPASLSPNFIDHARYLEMRRYGLVIEGIFAGILIAAGVFGCYSALQNRDRTSLLYAAWIVVALLSSTILPVHDGSRIYEFLLNFEGLRVGPAYVTRLVGNSLGYLQAVGYVLFARSFLDLKTEIPLVYRFSNVYLTLTFFHWLLMVPFYHVALTLPPLLTWGPYATMLIAMLLSVAVFIWTAQLEAGALLPFALICVLSGAALGADLALPPALLAGVIAAAGHSGEREGAYFGLWTFTTKMNLALAAGISLPLLSWLGYVPGQATDEGLRALVVAYALLPCALKLAAAALLWRAPLKDV